jgi:hypothetical protein
MFQYAAGLRLSLKTGVPLILDTTYLNDRFPRRNFTPRSYSLDVFQLEPKFTTLSKASRHLPIPGFWLALDAIGSVGRIVREKYSDSFDSAVLQASGRAQLVGHWQSEKYFADVEEDVRCAFRFRRPLIGTAAEVAARIDSADSVSLHVRRGDYVAFKNVKAIMGETTSSGYYDKAIAAIAGRIKNPTFFVFSDDIAWCKENIKIDFPVFYLDSESAGAKDENHLELMSRCKHNIIANSTFSWWGAWLNRNPEKIIIAPEQWYRDGRPSDAIIPESWIKI